MEGAIRAFRTAAAEMGILHKPIGLLLDAAKHCGNGQTDFRRFKRAAAEIGYGLNMHAPHMGGIIQGEADYISKLTVVYAGGHRRHQHNGQAGCAAVFYGAELSFRERRASHSYVNLIFETVKLQKHCTYPGLGQMPGIACLICKAQAVGIELEEAEALFLAEGNYFVQIVPDRRLAAGELNVEGAAVGHQHIVLLCDFFKAQVFLRTFLPS